MINSNRLNGLKESVDILFQIAKQQEINKYQRGGNNLSEPYENLLETPNSQEEFDIIKFIDRELSYSLYHDTSYGVKQNKTIANEKRFRFKD